MSAERPFGLLEHRVSPVLIGRADLLALVLRRWSEVRSGTGRLLLVSGEAGIGKTRLIEELVAQVGGGARVITAVAYPRDAEAAGALLLDLADAIFRAGLREEARALHRILAGREGDSVQRRRVMVGELVEALRVLLAGESTLLRIEDLHWADELTLDVLARLARALPELPSMVVTSIRTDELYPRTALAQWRALLLEKRLAEEVRLSRLSRRETEELALTLTGSTPPAALLDELHEHSDGIPLHVEELLAAGSTESVPETIAEAVRTRAGLLRAPAQHVAEAASVVGRAFAIELLEAISEEPAQEVDRAVQDLVERNLVAAAASGRFVFRHALICDAVYADIPLLRRRRLHRATAEAALARGFHASFVSDQYEKAGMASEAHPLALAAAEEAVRVSAHREAALLYRRALRTEPLDLDTRQRALLRECLAAELVATDENDEADALLAEAITLYRSAGHEPAAAALVPRRMAVRHLLGDGLLARAALAEDALDRIGARTGGEIPEVRAALLAALAACYMLDRRLDEALEYSRAAAEGTDPASPLSVQVDATLGSVLVFAGRGDEGWRVLEGAVERGKAGPFEWEAARAYRMIGTSASVLVEYDRAERWLAEGLAYSERTERWNDHHYMLAHLAHVKWATGRWAEAQEIGRRAFAEGGGGVTTRITAEYVLGYLALGRGEGVAARRHLSAAYETGRAMAELQRLSPPLWGLAELALLEDRLDDCRALCDEGYAASAAVDDAAYLFPFVVVGARARIAARDTSAARDWVQQCRRILTERALPGTLPALSHAEGLVALAEGRTGAARTLLEEAVSGWRLRRRFWEGTRALLDLAVCAERSRRPGPAAVYRAQGREAAERAGAVALLADLPSASGPRDLTLLSARELEVARLVVGGATNREIAERLTISPKTAAAHIEHILAKLGATRRSEIAAWAVRHIRG